MADFEIETTTAFDVSAMDEVSVNGGRDWLKVWSTATLRNGRNVGLRFEERDSSGRRLYCNLRSENTLLRKKS